AYPETSAKHFLRDANASIAFHGEADDILGDTFPMSWSQGSTLVFGRGNRIHMKNIGLLNEDVFVLSKLKEHHGTLRLLECGDASSPNHVAIATSKGLIQIWDVLTKKMVRTWYTKPPTALRWAGPVLSVGGEKGTIRHFDTRINDASRMKDETKKVTRHQARITSLAWNHDGRVLASGDAGGVIHCWDNRVNQLGPLDVGDQIQRHRRKMQHAGAVKALAWCPWSLKILSSGDAAEDGSGTIRLWNINETSPKPPNPDRIELNAQVTSLQWSMQCKELLSTHSVLRVSSDETTWNPYAGAMLEENAVAVHSFPSLSRVTVQYPASMPVLGSALSPSGCKVAFAVPGEKMIKIWDVWGKRK
ncbi:WD40-repeat-containing domain protein, partial [Vararia minispora EC-137]